MRDLNVSIVQCMLHWEDAGANRAMLQERLAALKGTTDLIVLPEMFTTGFSMRSGELAEGMEGTTVAWMRDRAADLGAASATRPRAGSRASRSSTCRGGSIRRPR